MTLKQEHHLEALNNKHKMLDEKIKDYETHPSVDDAVIHQLKKEKLAVKDQITAFKKQISV